MITVELQHNLVVVYVDERQRNKAEWKPEGQKRNIAKLRDERYLQLFECRVKKIMSDSIHDLWGLLENVC